MNATTFAVIEAGRRQGIVLALAAAKALSWLWTSVAGRLAAQLFRASQQPELAALTPAEARDLGIDAALLRQAGSFAASTHWIHH